MSDSETRSRRFHTRYRTNLVILYPQRPQQAEPDNMSLDDVAMEAGALRESPVVWKEHKDDRLRQR